MVEVGEDVPTMALVDTDLNKVSLKKTIKKGTTVIAFFPGAFTGVCTKEMCTFRDNLQKLNSVNANLIAISVDGPFPNKVFKEQNNLNFTILSDYKRKAVRAFDIPLKDFAGLKGYTAAKRAVFIAGADGKLKWKWVTDDPTVEPNYQAIEAALANLK